ncbi:MAG: hypothetical protein Q9171_001701 [Xanthocarpia ochracea]
MPKPASGADAADPYSPFDGSHGQHCKESFIKKKSETPQGSAPVTGSHSCDASGTGCTLSQQGSFTAGTSFEVGGSLGLSIGSIVGIGLSVSVAQTESKEYGYVAGSEKACPPGNWYCGLVISYEALKVEGEKIPIVKEDEGAAPRGGSICHFGPPEPWSILAPIERGDGELKGLSVDICACPNAQGWADDGAPSKVCPQPCPGIPEGE